MKAPALLAPLWLLPLLGCPAAPPPAPSSPAAAPSSQPASQPNPNQAALDRVAAVHGGAGPWAVLGYRMGEYALGVFGLERGAMELEVIHHTPRAVQYACVADGAAAATGASAGKLNLTLKDADRDGLRTTFVDRRNGKSITLIPAPGFEARFLNIPREAYVEAGRTVMTLPQKDAFVMWDASGSVTR